MSAEFRANSYSQAVCPDCISGILCTAGYKFKDVDPELPIRNKLGYEGTSFFWRTCRSAYCMNLLEQHSQLLHKTRKFSISHREHRQHFWKISSALLHQTQEIRIIRVMLKKGRWGHAGTLLGELFPWSWSTTVTPSSLKGIWRKHIVAKLVYRGIMYPVLVTRSKSHRNAGCH